MVSRDLNYVVAQLCQTGGTQKFLQVRDWKNIIIQNKSLRKRSSSRLPMMLLLDTASNPNYNVLYKKWQGFKLI